MKLNGLIFIATLSIMAASIYVVFSYSNAGTSLAYNKLSITSYNDTIIAGPHITPVKITNEKVQRTSYSFDHTLIDNSSLATNQAANNGTDANFNGNIVTVNNVAHINGRNNKSGIGTNHSTNQNATTTSALLSMNVMNPGNALTSNSQINSNNVFSSVYSKAATVPGTSGTGNSTILVDPGLTPIGDPIPLNKNIIIFFALSLLYTMFIFVKKMHK